MRCAANCSPRSCDLRRARLDPETVGIGVNSRRRVPGLRREEVAQLADVGITWTTLPERLCESVPEFRAIWDRHDVAGPERRAKRYRHPEVGEMTFESTALVLADAPTPRLMLLRPIDEGSTNRLARLRASSA